MFQYFYFYTQYPEESSRQPAHCIFEQRQILNWFKRVHLSFDLCNACGKRSLARKKKIIYFNNIGSSWTQIDIKSGRNRLKDTPTMTHNLKPSLLSNIKKIWVVLVTYTTIKICIYIQWSIIQYLYKNWKTRPHLIVNIGY